VVVDDTRERMTHTAYIGLPPTVLKDEFSPVARGQATTIAQVQVLPVGDLAAAQAATLAPPRAALRGVALDLHVAVRFQYQHPGTDCIPAATQS